VFAIADESDPSAECFRHGPLRAYMNVRAYSGMYG